VVGVGDRGGGVDTVGGVGEGQGAGVVGEGGVGFRLDGGGRCEQELDRGLVVSGGSEEAEVTKTMCIQRKRDVYC